MSNKSYLTLATHYKNCLIEGGDTFSGMGWPRQEDNFVRFAVMTEMIKPHLRVNRKLSILDFGCGTSHFYDYLAKNGLGESVKYTGLDILKESVLISKLKHPNNKYICADIIEDDSLLGMYDFILINGVFTQKLNMKSSDMKFFFQSILKILFKHTKIGISFNAMSQFVDFKKRGAFHLSLDYLCSFLCKEMSRNFIIRHDYGLYENTVLVYKVVNGKK